MEQREGERFPLSFSESRKNNTDFGKKTLIVSIYSKSAFSNILDKKLQNISLQDLIFLTKYQNMSLNNYSSTCRVTLCNVLCKTYIELWHIQNPVYYSKFRHTQAYSRLLQIYSLILWYIQNPM